MTCVIALSLKCSPNLSLYEVCEKTTKFHFFLRLLKGGYWEIFTSPKNYSKSRISCLLLCAGNSNFKFRICSDLEHLFWRFDKHISLFEKRHLYILLTECNCMYFFSFCCHAYSDSYSSEECDIEKYSDEWWLIILVGGSTLVTSWLSSRSAKGSSRVEFL